MIFDVETRIAQLQARLHALNMRDPVTNAKIMNAIRRDIRKLGGTINE